VSDYQYPTPKEVVKGIVAHVALCLVDHALYQIKALLRAQLFGFVAHMLTNGTNVK
jgi:hypothetical protein